MSFEEKGEFLVYAMINGEKVPKYRPRTKHIAIKIPPFQRMG